MKTLENDYIESNFKKLNDSDDDFFEPMELDLEEIKFRKLKGKALYMAS